MAFDTLHPSASSADAAAGVLCLLALANHKRKVDETDKTKTEDCIKRHKANYDDFDANVKESNYSWSTPYPTPTLSVQTPDRTDHEDQPSQVGPNQKIQPSQSVSSQQKIDSRKKSGTDRVSRLEQNRIAAKVSRERKKAMMNELQRSITFFRETNLAVQKQNDQLESLIARANVVVSRENDRKQEGKKKNIQGSKMAPVLIPNDVETADTSTTGQASTVQPIDLSVIQPGSTVQAMSNFQQAATKAMAAAMANLQRGPVLPTSNVSTDIIANVCNSSISMPIPQFAQSASITASITDTSGINFQQYMETLTAFAFQNSMLAAAAFANSQHHQQQQAPLMATAPFMSGPFFALPQQFEQKPSQA